MNTTVLYVIIMFVVLILLLVVYYFYYYLPNKSNISKYKINQIEKFNINKTTQLKWKNVGNNIISQVFDYTVDLNLGETSNIESFDVYLNNQYYGSDLYQIQINTNDVLRIVVVKNDDTLEGSIVLQNQLV